jgi:hypothetical protein
MDSRSINRFRIFHGRLPTTHTLPGVDLLHGRPGKSQTEYQVCFTTIWEASVVSNHQHGATRVVIALYELRCGCALRQEARCWTKYSASHHRPYRPRLYVRRQRGQFRRVSTNVVGRDPAGDVERSSENRLQRLKILRMNRHPCASVFLASPKLQRQCIEKAVCGGLLTANFAERPFSQHSAAAYAHGKHASTAK